MQTRNGQISVPEAWYCPKTKWSPNDPALNVIFGTIFSKTLAHGFISWPFKYLCAVFAAAWRLLNDPTSRSALDILYQGVIKWGFLLKELSIQKFERNRLRVYRLDFNMNDERTYICFTIIRLFVVCCVTLPKFLIAYNIFPYLVPIKSGSRMQSECQDKEVGKNDLQIFGR